MELLNLLRVAWASLLEGQGPPSELLKLILSKVRSQSRIMLWNGLRTARERQQGQSVRADVSAC
jgi:hypothetical protein